MLDNVHTPACRHLFAALSARVETRAESLDASAGATMLWACNVAQLLPQPLLEGCAGWLHHTCSLVDTRWLHPACSLGDARRCAWAICAGSCCCTFWEPLATFR